MRFVLAVRVSARTNPEMVQAIITCGKCPLFWIITGSMGLRVVMFDLIEYQFSICLRNWLQICFLGSLFSLNRRSKTVKIKKNRFNPLLKMKISFHSTQMRFWLWRSGTQKDIIISCDNIYFCPIKCFLGALPWTPPKTSFLEFL